RAEWYLLFVDTGGTAAALTLVLLRMTPAVIPIAVLAARLRGAERFRLIVWVLLLPGIIPIACSVPATPLQVRLIVLLAAAAVRLTKYRWLRWMVLLPIVVMYGDILALHFLSNSHPSRRVLARLWPWPAMAGQLAERCRQNDGRRPLNLRDEQLA